MAYNKNGKYTQEQITEMLYAYMVEGQRAAYVCKDILGMTEAEIGNTRSAWTKLQRYYNAYGFKKRYNNGLAFRNISKGKLREYVRCYWDKRATEKDLIAFFPEILNDLNEAKRIEGEKELHTDSRQSTGTKSTNTKSNPYASFERREPRNHQEREQGNHQRYSSTSNTTAKKKLRSNQTNYNRTPQTSGSRNTYTKNTYENPIYNEDASNNETTSLEAGSVLAIVVCIILIIAVWKSGIITAIGHAITNAFSNLLWILELLFFYGGIIIFIISLFRKTTRRCWKGCVGISALGLCFGFLSTGNFLTAIIIGIISLGLMATIR